MSFKFTAEHYGEDKLGLKTVLQRYADEQWVGEHYTPEQAEEAIADRFRRAICQEMELMRVRVACLDAENEFVAQSRERRLLP